MIKLEKKQTKKNINFTAKSYNSVCNSCSCTSPSGEQCNQTCKGCKDKGETVKEVKAVYSK